MEFSITIRCNCANRVVSWDAENQFTASPGFTPLPLGLGNSVGEGSFSITCSSFGSGVYCNAFERSRVGPMGQAGWQTIFPGTGVPYRWSRIECILRCDRTYDIGYSASYFPSHNAYLQLRA